MKIATADKDVVCMELNDDVRLAPTKDFRAEFPDCPISPTVRTMNYEPDRQIYQIGRKDGSVDSYTLPTESPLLAWFAENWEAAYRYCEYAELMRKREYRGDDYTWDGSQWVRVPDPRKANLDAQVWVENHAVEVAVALSYLWEIAERKNLFQGETIPAEVQSTMDTIINKRDLATS